MGDALVLAVYTALRAACKENGPGAACAGDAGFFPEMRRRTDNAHLSSHAAKPRGIGHGTVGKAVSRTQITVRHGVIITRFRDLFTVFSVFFAYIVKPIKNRYN